MYNSRQMVAFIWPLLFLASIINPAYSQEVLQSRMVYYTLGTQYAPVNQATQLILTTSKSSLKACAIACNQNVLCGNIDYDISTSGQ